ncbi:MAG: Gfo/Idh/MocA family oxidoreductase [Chloroflexi bacterium]|nr:Gfo/Idh/MocA family oxidoreductase [Chloroflexota bacterium]
MQLAIIGCGFIADDYMYTLANYPHLQVVGVLDVISDRATRFAAFWKIPHVYQTLDEVLADSRVDIVLNLTNPKSHFEISRACLLADKHVYSEKPLAMVFEEARELAQLAKQRGLYITSAPCSVLGETAQTLWKALRQQVIGQPRLVYAELDDGMIHQMNYREWISDSGSPWPYKDEFEVGCTLEHAGYYVTWLAAFFGPAKSVSTFTSQLIPDKQTDVPIEIMSPDFSVACIEFASGVVARLTCSIVAPHDHSLRIVGDDGILSTHECWNYGSPVYIKRPTAPSKLSRVAKRLPVLNAIPGIAEQQYPLVRKSTYQYRTADAYQMDYARGVEELAAAVEEKRPCRMSAQFALHVNEIVLSIQYPQVMGSPRHLTTSFEPMRPMIWAEP